MQDNYVSIINLKPNEKYHQVFLVNKAVSRGKFVFLTFKDVTGEISGILIGDIPPPNEGDFISLEIKTSIYNGKLSFKSSNYFPFKGSINRANYICDMATDFYKKQIISILSIVDSAEYRDIINYSIKNLSLLDLLENSPYGSSGKFAFRGGLLVYTYFLLKSAINAGSLLERNVSFLILSALFRNIGWATTTKINADIIELLDSYHLIGTDISGLRFVNHMLISYESETRTELSLDKKLTLENIFLNTLSLEGRLINNLNRTLTEHFIEEKKIYKNVAWDDAHTIFNGVL